MLVIILALFGTKKLVNIGKDLGNAIKGFKDATKSEEEKAAAANDNTQNKSQGQVIEGEAKREPSKTDNVSKDKV